jgi:periplasmic protein CpxP/Spy
MDFSRRQKLPATPKMELESIYMWNSTAAKRSSWLTTAFLAGLLSLGSSAGSAFAQDTQDAPPPPSSSQQPGPGMGRGMGHHPMGSVDDQIKHLSKKLNLSDDQQAKLKPILEDQRKKMEAIHGGASISREDRFGKMQALRQSSDAQIKSVLNEEQQKSFDEMRAEQQERMKQWRRGGDNAPPPPAGGAADSPQQ